MAQSRTKLNRFITSNGLTNGVIFHQQLKINYLIARLPETEPEAIYRIAGAAINNLGSPIQTAGKRDDYSRRVQELLTLNGVYFRLINTAPRGGKHGDCIVATSLGEVINYDASKK